VTAPSPDEIAKQFIAHYQPIVDLNTGAVAGFEALARVIDSDGSVTTAGEVIEEIEGQSDTLRALIWTILQSIRRDMVPLFERHQNFYVSVNIPPVVLGSYEIPRQSSTLHFKHYGTSGRIRQSALGPFRFNAMTLLRDLWEK
jgi:sensor c-di-GMP phosphodiesterase-like protein